MKKRNIFILSCLSVFLLGACSGSNNTSTKSNDPTSATPTHTHTFSDEWTSDEQYHWHASTCGHDVVSDKAAHTMNDNGFCSVCNRYLGQTFNFHYDEQLGFADYVHPQMNMEANQKYYCRIGGGHTGHKIYLEDGDPWSTIETSIHGYIMNGGTRTNVDLAYATPSNLIGDDGYLYILLDASTLDNLNDVWFRICEEHLEGTLTPDKLDYLGICPVCGEYRFPNHTKNPGVHFSTHVSKNLYQYIRVPVTEDGEYGLWTAFNDVVGTVGEVKAFIVKDGAPVLLQTAHDYETRLLHVSESDDKYVYLVYSYTGSPTSVTLEDTMVTRLVHGCDEARWFYGKVRDDFSDSFDLEDEDYKINGKYVIGIDIQAPETYGYKFQFDGITSSDLATMKVYQDNLTSVVEILPNSSGYYIGVSAEDLIVEFSSSVPGTQIDMTVIEQAI